LLFGVFVWIWVQEIGSYLIKIRVWIRLEVRRGKKGSTREHEGRRRQRGKREKKVWREGEGRRQGFSEALKVGGRLE